MATKNSTVFNGMILNDSRKARRERAAQMQAEIEAKRKGTDPTDTVAEEVGRKVAAMFLGGSTSAPTKRIDTPGVRQTLPTAAEKKAAHEAELRRQVLEDIAKLDPKFNGEGLTLKDLRNTLRSITTQAGEQARNQARAQAALDKEAARQAKAKAPKAPAAAPTPKAEKEAKPTCHRCHRPMTKWNDPRGSVFCTWKCGWEYAMEYLKTNQPDVVAHLPLWPVIEDMRVSPK
jgi:hypothetical protein